jgi:hypothetical protein
LEEAEEQQRLAVELASRTQDDPLRGQRLVALAHVLALRGRTDEAKALRDEGALLLAANPEPQAFHFVPYVDGFLALARGDRSAAAEHFRDSARYLSAHSLEMGPEVITEAVRSLVRTGDRQAATELGELVPSMTSLQSAAHARNINGLLETNPDQAAVVLRSAVDEFERLEMHVLAARAMVDLAWVLREMGKDASELLQRARESLVASDAQLVAFEVDEAERLATMPESADLPG